MESDLIARGLALAERVATQGGLSTGDWRVVRDAGAALEGQLNGREPTARERWLIDTGRRAGLWLGPPLEEPSNEVD